MARYGVESAVQVLQRQGVPREEIACRLGLSAHTVRNIQRRFVDEEARDSAREKKLRSQSKRLGQLVRQAGGHR